MFRQPRECSRLADQRTPAFWFVSRPGCPNALDAPSNPSPLQFEHLWPVASCVVEVSHRKRTDRSYSQHAVAQLFRQKHAQGVQRPERPVQHDEIHLEGQEYFDTSTFSFQPCQCYLLY